jgi:hypothetical protein
VVFVGSNEAGWAHLAGEHDAGQFGTFDFAEHCRHARLGRWPPELVKPTAREELGGGFDHGRIGATFQMYKRGKRKQKETLEIVSGAADRLVAPWVA